MAPNRSVSRTVEASLRLIGAWPNCSCSIVQRVMWTLLMTFSQIFQYRYLITHITSGDLPDLLDCLSLTLSNSLLFFKLIMIWYNTRTFYDILATMFEDWSDCTSIDWTAKTIMSKAMLSDHFSHGIIGAFSMSAILYSTSALLVRNKNNETLVMGDRNLLLKMEFPFDATISPVYEVITVVQLVSQVFSATMAGMMLALMVNLILHVGSQIEIMCHELAEISTYCHVRGSCISLLKSLISRHQRIIFLSDNIEDVFTYMSLMQFLLNTMVICFLGFVIVTSIDMEMGPSIFVKCLPYYVLVNFEAFILCYTGEYLMSKSATISQAAYSSVWYELNPRECRMLLTLILRSQRRLSLTAGKFVVLSLESYTSILKASASYVSVLHAMY